MLQLLQVRKYYQEPGLLIWSPVTIVKIVTKFFGL
jgi:hypothetical protein